MNILIINLNQIIKINELELTWNSEMKIYSDINDSTVVVTLRNGNYFLTDENGNDLKLSN
tara:strand:- start:97 stop:276 length:180 start_codon:yes stop_codon:yes gene_type:complete